MAKVSADLIDLPQYPTIFTSLLTTNRCADFYLNYPRNIFKPCRKSKVFPPILKG